MYEYGLTIIEFIGLMAMVYAVGAGMGVAWASGALDHWWSYFWSKLR